VGPDVVALRVREAGELGAPGTRELAGRLVRATMGRSAPNGHAGRGTAAGPVGRRVVPYRLPQQGRVGDRSREAGFYC
jgi:hypothetical protein